MCMLFAFQALQLVLAVVGVDVTFGPGQTRSTVVGLAFLGFVISFFFYLWPAIRLLRYAKAIGFLLEQKTAVELEEALNIQRGFWKYIGIITLILLILFVGFLFLAMAGALATARH